MRSPPRVSCIVPAYNEAATIGAVVRAVAGCPAVGEVIVVSDGSTDATAARAAEAGATRVLALPVNAGKGAAVWTALREASGDVVLLLDGDLIGLEGRHAALLLHPVLSGEAEMTVAELRDDRLHELLGGFSGQRAFRRDLVSGADDLAATGFGLEVALDRLARRRNARVRRVPLSGLTHRRKRQKYGLVRGLRMQTRTAVDVGRQLGHGALVAAAVLVMISLPLVRAHADGRSLSSVRPLPLARPRASDRILVVVAHPDDEIIGAGGLIALARQAGAPVTVLILTNGDANRVTAAAVGRRLWPGAFDFQASGRLRQLEAHAALHAVGLSARAIRFGGFPDRGLERVLRSATPAPSPFTGYTSVAYAGVQEHGAPYTRDALLGVVRSVVDAVQPVVIVTHAPFDAHPDHRAVYRAVREVAGDAGLYTFLVHARGFPSHTRYGPAPVIVPPPRGPVEGWTWRSLELPPEIRERKREALRAYRSQWSSPYLRGLFNAFETANELYALPPAGSPSGGRPGAHQAEGAEPTVALSR